MRGRDPRITEDVVIKIIELRNLGFYIHEIAPRTPWHKTTINKIFKGFYHPGVWKRTMDEIELGVHTWRLTREFMQLDQKLVEGEKFSSLRDCGEFSFRRESESA